MRAGRSSPATAPRWCSASFGTDIDDGAPARSRLFARDRAASTTEAVDVHPSGVTWTNLGGPEYYDVSADGRYVVFDFVNPGLLRQPGLPRVHRRLLARPADRHHRAGQRRPQTAPPAETWTPTTPRSAPTDSGWCSPPRRPTSSPPPSAPTRTSSSATWPRTPPSSSARAPPAPPATTPRLDPAISADGTTVAFASAANNLDPDGPSSNDLFLRHLDTDTTEAVLPTGHTYQFTQAEPDLSADGTVVAFYTRTDLLGTGSQHQQHPDLHDRPHGRHDPHRAVPRLRERDRARPQRRRLVTSPTGPRARCRDGLPGVYVWDREADTTEVESVRSDGTAMQHPAVPELHVRRRSLRRLRDPGECLPRRRARTPRSTA